MDTLRLDVPYLSQRDNWCNPHGSCNVTSIAMCAAHHGVPQYVGEQQLEDVLYRYCCDTGLSRHSPEHLAILTREIGIAKGLRFTDIKLEDDYTSTGRWKDVEESLQAGNPCVIHGWFTRSGHIVTIVGYTSTGWIVHDPYGIWDGRYGYSAESGAFVEYGHGAMSEVCGRPGDMWLHRIRRVN